MKIYVQKQAEHGKRDLGDASYDLEARGEIGELFSAVAALFARLFVRGASSAVRFATVTPAHPFLKA